MLDRFKKLFASAPPPAFPDLAALQLATLDSGLQLAVLEPGAGKKPTSASRVRVHYAGWTSQGQYFDGTLGTSGPAEFALFNVIKGWTEGLQHLAEGGKAVLVIPPQLAYGARGAPPRIGANATLVFRVELEKVLSNPA
jgi:FKBP-type peptidyl-prolyl cis-trans isomerase